MEEIIETLAACNRTSVTLSIDHNVLEDLRAQFVAENVQITPPKMVFTDAFDGKQFRKSFTIINSGKYPVFIRIFPPTSQSFKMKPLRKGRHLPSGLSVTRTIEYTHNSAMALNKAYFFVYVNEKPHTYQIEVHLISAYVTLDPKVLNFGEIDVGNASQQLSIKLRNVGHKLAQFSIDVGRDDLELIVDPMKGTVMPDGVVEVKVEVLGSQTGTFNKEFWVKTEPPRRVKLTGVFIAPRIVIKYPISAFDLTMVDFPKTYYGAESVRTVIVSNNSSTDRMFCLLSERGKELNFLRISKQTNNNLKCFAFNSLEGRLLARQNHILSFTFKPIPMENFTRKFCQAFIRVAEVSYRDGVVAESRDEVVKTFTSATSIEEFVASPIDNLQEFDSIELFDSSYVRLCLYGEMEEPRVKLSPEDFTLSYLTVDETYDRIVNIKNQSHHLPIGLRRKILPCVKVRPSEVFLAPQQSLEITLSITPSEEGKRSYKIIFDLIHSVPHMEYKVGSVTLPIKFCATRIYPRKEPKFNMGITPQITNEVGFLVDDVRFNSKIDKPRQAIVDKNHKSFDKKNADLIAFPNDMPKCLRPWRSKVPCRTIFSNLPRIVSDQDEYTLTMKEVENKGRNNKIYSDYIKELGARPRWSRGIIPCNKNYEVTNRSRLLMQKLPLSEHVSYRYVQRFSCIPLPPEKLMEVIIKPKYVYLGKIAPYTTCTDSFSIENRNEFPIHVSIKALSNSVVIKEKSRIVIGPKKTKNIFFDCFSHGYGKFYVPVYIIINDNHIFDGTVFASVVPTTVRCDQKEIIINPKTHRSFFELFNPVNCDIKFSWEIQDRNFKVIPDCGVVPSRKNVYCSVMFIPQINATYKTEIYLLSQSGAKQIITVICKNERASIGFSAVYVDFKNIPLNITVIENVVLRNFSDEEIMYLVNNPNPIDEITVSPVAGKINAKSDVDFSITALFNDVISFNCPVTFIMQDNYTYTVDITGNVVYPTVTITPENIQIPKGPLHCCRRYNFKMKNTSAAKNVISFHLDDIPEFTVTDLEHKPITNAFTLKPDEAKEMILEFSPFEQVAYSLYFPYKMNDIIGPPLLNDSTSLRPENYFRKKREICIKRTVELSKAIRTLNIRCAANASWFTFSSIYLAFNYEKNVKCRKRFSITNVSVTDHHFTIPKVDPKYPFTVKLEKKNDHELTDDSWKFIITPDETVSFKIEYIPSDYGECSMELPLYVEKFSEEYPFNYLKLCGVYNRPLITCECSLVYFQAIKAKEKASKRVTLKLDFHQQDCVLELNIQHETLSGKLLKRVASGKTNNAIFNSTVDCLVKFSPKEECIVRAPIIFTCSCGVSREMLVRASANNSIFCCYQSFIKARAASENEKFESTFPFFPHPKNDSYYARTVKVIKDDVERWLFSQGFFYMGFFKIPYGLARFPVNIEPILEAPETAVPKSKLKFTSVKPPLILPLVQLLVNLIDPNVTQYFYEGTSEPCFEGIKGVVYVYTVYKNIIKFLEAQGVFVSVLKPEYLLPYRKYIIFKESVIVEDSLPEKLFSASDFLYFTKQVWLDLMLRIYRVFMYNRATNLYISQNMKSSLKPLIYGEALVKYFNDKRNEFGEEVSESERKLMTWLQFHFENQRHILWDKHTNSKLANRKIRFFEKDLADSLPFVTLMVAYCPYMSGCFDNFFPLYQNEEDIYHNACLIYETWKRLRLSYDLRPNRIVKSSATEMEILVTYLYDVLPNFYPSETITFNTSLGDISVNKLVLKNKGDAVIAYTPLFFLNDTEAFQVDTDIVTIAPGGVNNLKISYKAKSILKKTAVLVLSGETIGYKFAKTMTFNLVGIPNIFQFTEEFSFNAEVFKYVNRTFEVTSPFGEAYGAKLYFFFGDQEEVPESLDEFQSVSSIKMKKIPRQICVNPECEFDSDGGVQITLHMSYIACGKYTYFLYFSNKDVGDFCIKINVEAMFSVKRAVDLPVELPMRFSTKKCICSHRTMNVECPRMFSVDLPSTNHQLIEGLKTMFRACGKEEYNFWNPLLDSAKGFHVLDEYFENTFEDVLVPFKAVLQHRVTYNVRTKVGKNLTIARNITIEDVTSNRPYKLEGHWNGNQWPESLLLNLVASHEQEIRRYVLRFVKPKPSIHSNAISNK